MISAVAALNKDIENIREVVKEQGAVNVFASTLEKRAAEKNMITPCVKTANALYVIGFTSDNKELITLQDTNYYSFYRTSHNAALALVKQILDLAKQYAKQLGEYGIKEDKLKEIDKAINAFQTIIAKPMDTIGERKQKTTNLAQLFAALDSTFYDRLDKLMVLFKQTAPDFYGEYRTARNIIFNHERPKATGGIKENE
jgi:RNA-binding protein YhbY